MNKKFYNVLFNTAKIIGIAVVVFILILCLATTADIDPGRTEKTIFSPHEASFYVKVVLEFALIVIGGFLIKKMSSKKLFAICSAIYCLMGMYIILNTGNALRADAAIVYDYSKNFINGDYTALNFGEYLFRYPHQLGLLSYEMLVSKLVSMDVRAVFTLNLLWAVLINLFTYKLTDLWFYQNRLANNITILLTHLFLPQLFFIKFAYGLIPSFAFITFALYNATLFYKNGKTKNFIFTAVFASIAVVLRSNSLLAIITFILIFALLIIKKPKVKTAILLVLLIVAMFLPQTLVNNYYEKRTGIEITEGEPKVLWVAMGMQECKARANGWWNAYNQDTFSETGYDIEEAKKIANEYIDERLEEFKADPAYTVKFYMEKIKSTWCNPTFQSVWTGPVTAYQENKTALMNDIYSGGVVYDKIFKNSNTLLVIILLFASIFLIFKRGKDNPLILFPVVFMIGAFLFHILWETKSQYVYIYIFALIPLSAKAVSMTHEGFKKVTCIGLKKVKSLLKKKA